MGRLMGEDNKSSAGSSEHVVLKETVYVSDERTCKVDDAGVVSGNDGDLPLFFPTNSTSSPPLSSKADDLNAESENHKHVEAGWPLGNREIGSWASSFRFEFDSQDSERLQAMLEREEQVPTREISTGRKLNGRWNSKESSPEGGSFRFMRHLAPDEILSGNQCRQLKSPRQPGSSRIAAVTRSRSDEKQGSDTAQSSDALNVSKVGVYRIKLAVNHIPGSPRSEVLQRLRDLKAHPSSPRFTPEDAVSCQNEKAKLAAVRDDFHQRLKLSLSPVKNEVSSNGSTNPVSQYQCKPQVNVLSELEIMELKEKRQQSSSPSELRGSPRRSAQSPLQMHPTTPTSRFRDDKMKLDGGYSMQERLVNIPKQSQVTVSHVNSPSPDHVPSTPVAIPFKWEEEPGKPKTIAAAVNCALARRLSRDGTESSEYVELQLGSQKGVVESGNSRKGTGPEASGRSSPNSSNVDHIERSGSHRYYGRGYLRVLSRHASLRRSSRRHEKEALIDLGGSAAAKFLVEAFDSPSRSPSVRGSSPTFVVPFKWEDAPGKAKPETTVQRPHMLQLPPRLAVPSLSRDENLTHEYRASYPFAGLFLPCLTTASTSVHRKQTSDLQPTSSRSLPPRFPSPPERRKRTGLISRCSSTPKEECQIRVSRSFNYKASVGRISSEKGLDQPPSIKSSAARKSRNLSVSELKAKSNVPSSPTSILCGPDEGGSQTSGSCVMFSSGDLEDFAPQTSQSRKMASKSSSSTSSEYAAKDLAESTEAATTPSALTSAEDTGLLDKEGAPTSSGCLSRKGEPRTLEALPTMQSVAKQQAVNSSPKASPKRPSRLAYTMPSATLASCSTSGRRQLLQDLSPRLLHQYSGRSHSGAANTSYRNLTSAPRVGHEKSTVPPSTAYAVALELFSPAVSLSEQRRRRPATPKAALAPLKPSPPRPRRRVRLMSSIFKSLKRALGRNKRLRKRTNTKHTYIDGNKSPSTTFKLKTTYT